MAMPVLTLQIVGPKPLLYTVIQRLTGVGLFDNVYLDNLLHSSQKCSTAKDPRCR